MNVQATSGQSFFWHDYETFGRDPRRDRPAQFAGVRTDAELNEVGAPVMAYCRPSPDYLPDPESCLLTGITPQHCLAHGVPEREFAALILDALGAPGTIGVGYNSIRFDDEFTRFLFWRNLIDPYGREWQNGCGRWDLIDVVRCAYALRPDGIEWPRDDEGRVSFRLERLTAANGLAHDAAHDALSDVRATLALARLVRQRQRKLFDFCFALHQKDAVWQQIGPLGEAARPFLHVSSRYPIERGGLAMVWPLAQHPTNKNELIVWDLVEDPAELPTLDVDTLRLRLFTRAADLPEGVARLPIKTIHVNRSPVVIGQLKTLDDARAESLGLDRSRAQRHAAWLHANGRALARLPWKQVFQRPPADQVPDVEEDLYSGFIGPADRRQLERLRQLDGQALASKRPSFNDGRLEELLFRYRARHWPETLTGDEQARWVQHCVRRLHQGDGASCTLAAFSDQIDRLVDSGDEQRQVLLEALLDYAQAIAPNLDACIQTKKPAAAGF